MNIRTRLSLSSYVVHKPNNSLRLGSLGRKLNNGLGCRFMFTTDDCGLVEPMATGGILPGGKGGGGGEATPPPPGCWGCLLPPGPPGPVSWPLWLLGLPGEVGCCCCAPAPVPAPPTPPAGGVVFSEGKMVGFVALGFLILGGGGGGSRDPPPTPLDGPPRPSSGGSRGLTGGGGSRPAKMPEPGPRPVGKGPPPLPGGPRPLPLLGGGPPGCLAGFLPGF